MALNKRGEIYWIDISVRGRPRIRETTGLTDKKLAQEYHDKFKAKLYDSIQSGKTLGDAIKLWLKLKPRNKREISAIKTVLKIYPSRPLSEITGIDIHDALIEKSASNANRLANNIRSAINMAVDRKWCDEITIHKRDTNIVPTRFLTKEDWKRLQGELKPHVLAMATFALATGLRLHNVTHLQWVNVNMQKSMMWVDAIEAKGKKVIPVPLSTVAIDILKQQVGMHGSYVFVYRNKPVSSVKTSWKKALLRAKLFLVPTGKKDKNGDEIMKSIFRWHDLRHTWASWHVMNGTPIPVLKELGGWSDLELVNRYAHLSPEHVRKYVDNSN
jgi:integrase